MLNLLFRWDTDYTDFNDFTFYTPYLIGTRITRISLIFLLPVILCDQRSASSLCVALEVRQALIHIVHFHVMDIIY
ncbi:MAG: hypothetical protein A2W36_06745 [Chloroflexi bacterium RBG_16_58_14]|nr:MAG: hypothetical protein A2W36_06745 [Chloroflexi bacterium RBG_16_58_14]